MEIREVLKRSWVAAIAVGVVFILQGCLKSDGEDTYDGYKYLDQDIKTLQDYFVANNINVSMDSTTGIFYSIDGMGDGYKTVSQTEVEIRYQGSTLDGEEFVNNLEKSPVAFTLGKKDSYPSSLKDGLVIAMFKMHQGDTATIYCPSPYGFQDVGFQNVPPNSIIVYKVIFDKIKNLDTELAKIDQYITDNSMTAEIDSVYGTRYAIHRKGNSIGIKGGSVVSLKYTGQLLDKTQFDAGTLNFTFLGSAASDRYITGFEMGLFHLHENDSATIFVPSIYGYKDVANNEIPANSVLVFGLDITRVSN